ncbi:MAG TPA: YdjY domain-containing protein [Pirellulales bacterium]
MRTTSATRVGAMLAAALLASSWGVSGWIAAQETPAEPPAAASETPAAPAAEAPAAGETTKSGDAKPTDQKPGEEKPAAEAKPAETPAEGAAPAAPLRDAQGRIKLSPQYEVWLDPKAKELHVAGEVCLVSGQLEMLVTRKKTKTHESVVAVDCEAKVIHAGLMALGAEPGHTVRFAPQYESATGTEIGVFFRWTDGNGKEHTVPGQDWVRHVQTQRVMDSSFVFAGSLFTEGQYLAEQGDVVCVSNFPTAMLDLPVRSSDQASQLMFEAFAERIPPVRTPVTVVFRVSPKPATP